MYRMLQTCRDRWRPASALHHTVQAHISAVTCGYLPSSSPVTTAGDHPLAAVNGLRVACSHRVPDHSPLVAGATTEESVAGL
jgi:hypothetical protein